MGWLWRGLWVLALLGANVLLLAWQMGWSDWMPLPHETPQNPVRASEELRPQELKILNPAKETSP